MVEDLFTQAKVQNRFKVDLKYTDIKESPHHAESNTIPHDLIVSISVYLLNMLFMYSVLHFSKQGYYLFF